MGLGFVLLAWLLVGAVLFAVGAALSAILWLIVRPRKFWLRLVLIAFPFLVGAAPVGLFVAGLIWQNIAPAPLQYEAVFGHPPDRSVTDLNALASGTNDADDIYLAFRVTPSTLERDLAHFAPIVDFPDPMLANMNGDTPPWWRVTACRDRSMYAAKPEYASEDHRGSTYWETIFLVRCNEDGMVYVYASWVD